MNTTTAFVILTLGTLAYAAYTGDAKIAHDMLVMAIAFLGGLGLAALFKPE